MIEEFLRSLDGFEDQLTGLLSREAFKMHYSAMLGSSSMEKTSAALFSVRLNILYEALGAQASVEVLKALGEYTNRYFNNIGGFSARHSRDEILTIFPRKDLEEARKLVQDFADELENGGNRPHQGHGFGGIGDGNMFRYLHTRRRNGGFS